MGQTLEEYCESLLRRTGKSEVPTIHGWYVRREKGSKISYWMDDFW